MIERINVLDLNVVAYINHENKLSLKATRSHEENSTSFMIRYLEDSNELLANYAGILNAPGAANAFDFRRAGELSKLQSNEDEISFTPYLNPASHIAVSSQIQNNSLSLAAGRVTDRSGVNIPDAPNKSKQDNTNALFIAGIFKKKHI